MLQSPKGGLIQISDRSTLSSFTDDKGTNLLGKGNKLKTSSAGSSRMGFGNSVTVTKEFGFDKKVENCVLVVEVWTDKKDVELPFDVSIGIGG